jgi:hypothetical protein
MERDRNVKTEETRETRKMGEKDPLEKSAVVEQ